VTRNADTSITSSLQPNVIKSTDSYSIFFDISDDEGGDSADGANSQWLKGWDTSNSNLWTLRKDDTTNQRKHRLYYNLDSDYIFAYTNINKACFIFTDNEIKAFIDGSLHTTYTPTNSPLNFDRIVLDYGSANRTSIRLSNIVLFSKAITDQEAIDLTTI